MPKNITYGKKGVSFPQDYLANGLSCGIKTREESDLGLLISNKPAKCAGVFTKNHFIAAPIAYSRDNVMQHKVTQAVLVNSGNANACTGKAGPRAVQEVVKTLQPLLPFGSQPILTFSTGPIGVPLPAEKIQKKLPALVSGLGNRKDKAFAEAILTTDTTLKCFSAEFQVQGKTVRLGATAKGAGMIEPSMATMLCFITTDCDLPSKIITELLNIAVGQTFNRISVDGDQSTNDSVVLLANGASGVSINGPADPGYDLFLESLIYICQNLAEAIVRDGEGATKLVRVRVTEAKSEMDAEKVCRKVINGLLLKCALFGASPNWGRILASIGATDVPVNPAKLQVHLQGVLCFEKGEPHPKATLKLHKLMRKKDIEIKISLGAGDAAFLMLGNDLSFDYVKINLN